MAKPTAYIPFARGPLLDRLPTPTTDAQRVVYPQWVSGSAVVDAAGVGTVTIPVNTGKYWFVERIVVNVAAGTGVEDHRIYVNNVTPANLRDGVDNAAFQVADENSPIVFPPGSQVITQVTGAAVGVVYTVALQYLEG